LKRQLTPEELEYFYHITGRAIWHLQYVEESLGFLFLYKKIFVNPRSVEPDVAQTELKKVQKKTLGQLVVEIEKNKLLPFELIERLRKFNKERKWLVHKSLIEDGDNLYNHDGRNDVFGKIEEFTKESILLQKVIGEEILNYCESVGVSKEWQEAQGEYELRKLKGLA
jgi:hypothetical protein